MAFLGAVAHDIRNPLSVLSTSLDALAEHPSEAEIEQLVAILARQVGQIESLVADLLDAAQLETHQLPIRLATCDLREIAREVAELFALHADARRIELRLPPDPLFVAADPSRIYQALANLAGNALKFSPPDTAVVVTVQPDPRGAQVCVSDRGPGIPPAEQALVFEPFRRLSGGPGAGLGLFITERIVRAHGARIELDSRLGEGSTFRITFPPRNAAAAMADQPNEPL
jgi:signal transduction histidine kinase